MAIEEEFSIEIPDKDADTIHSSTFLLSPPHPSLPVYHALSAWAVISQPLSYHQLSSASYTKPC
jgi:hypothetical protein